MKKVIALASICGLIAFTSASTNANSNDQLARRILEAYPQADANGDGRLSKAELAAVRRIALKRYPEADSDGNGRLSAAEQEALLNKLKGSPQPSSLKESTASSEPLAESDSVREGARPIKPSANGVGRQIPDLTFTDISGTRHQLSDFANYKAVVFAMTGTGCPLCLKYAPTLADLERRYSDENVAFILINPNESEKLGEIREAIDRHGFTGPYVQDVKKLLPAILKAKTTTEVFVMDQARTLVYRGAVDDQYGFAYSLDAPRTSFLSDALGSVLRNETPDVQATTSPGCELFYDQPAQVETSVTYHNRISRIIQANCIECHRDDGIAPIALETYTQVKDYASMIRSVVRRKVMPPWFAEPHERAVDDGPDILHWANDRSLSDQEKEDLFAWIGSGAPEGDATDAPLPKFFPGGWLIGKPDREFAFPQPVPVKATGTMPYQNITVETNLEEDKWVQAIEVRPGKLDVVHHVIVSVKAGDGEFDERDGYWGAYVPGNSTLVYPAGYGRRLPKGAKLRFQMHYTPNGIATEDITRIGIIYCKEPPKHEVKVVGIANPKIDIPAHASNHPEEASVTLPSDIEVLAFLPHMHLRGKAALYELESVGGTEKLLDIPSYDFNWQLRYRLAEPRTLQRGDTIRFTAWYDNSKNNPANPNPNINVDWGQQTEDEMHLGYVEYTIPGAKPGERVAGLRSRNRTGRSISNTRGILGGIKALDRNRDGRLTKSEVPQQHLELFERLDANGDEVLTIQEAQDVIRQNSRQ